MKYRLSQAWLDGLPEEGPFAGLAGPLATDWLTDVLPPDKAAATPEHTFGRLLHVLRLRSRLSVDALAEKINVDPDDIRRIELEEEREPEPRLVYQIAKFFKLQVGKLNELAGLTTSRDPNLHRFAVQFAASSKPVESISPDELHALEALVAVLSEQDTGEDERGKK